MVPVDVIVATPCDVAVKTALVTPFDVLVSCETITDFELLTGVPHRQPDLSKISKEAETCVATVQGESAERTRTTVLGTTPHVAVARVASVVDVVAALAMGVANENDASPTVATRRARRSNVGGTDSVSHRRITRRPHEVQMAATRRWVQSWRDDQRMAARTTDTTPMTSPSIQP